METGCYIDGKWIHPKSNRLVRNINPADPDDVIAEFPAATAEDAERAIDAAQSAFRNWKNTPGPERGRVLWRAADIARRRADEIARTLTREEGKILKEAKGEVMKGISLLEFYAGEGFRMHGKTLPSEARDTFTYTIRRPLGVVGLIAPWNFPWAIPVWKSAPALAAGNCVILKPAAHAGYGRVVDRDLPGSRLSARRIQYGRGLRFGGGRSDRLLSGHPRRLIHWIQRNRRRALCQSGAARSESDLRDGRQERRHRHAGRRSRQSGSGHSRRRFRLHRTALHGDVARDRSS